MRNLVKFEQAMVHRLARTKQTFKVGTQITLLRIITLRLEEPRMGRIRDKEMYTVQV